MRKYKKRIADELLKRKLAGKGAVLIEGAKWCGKTTTAEQVAKSVLYMSQPGRVEQNKRMALMEPENLLAGEKPRLIDEWQLAPELWDAVRFYVDHADSLGQFVLTGSCVPPDMSKVHHTGTGRFAWLRMRPMSLWESNDSTGTLSLKELFEGKTKLMGHSNLDLRKLAFLTCRGGWPMSISLEEDLALDQAFEYLQAVEKRDLQEADGVIRDQARIHRLLRSYARHQGAQANFSTIKADLKDNEGEELEEKTIGAYIRALKNIFVIEDSEAWNPNLRSKTAIRTSDTRYFTDPSIATAALGLGPDDLMNDLNTFGLIFETLAVRDLRVYSEVINGTVYHYRDKNGLECDAVVHLRDGRYGLVEIKLGGEDLIDAGAKTLLNLASKLDTTKMKKPSFLMVLTGVGDYAYPREDGVIVVPIGSLKT